MSDEETKQDPEELMARILRRQELALAENAGRVSQAHDQFLKSRQESLQQMAGLFQAQAAAAGVGMLPDASPAAVRHVVYNRSALEEFATGRVANVLGPEFTIYDGRRSPRIPNGDLLLMDRVTAFSGKRLDFDTPATLEVEYDVPRDAWYLKDNGYPDLPYSVLMEIALQSCGMLSAHMASSLKFPEQEYFYRNLDGEALLLERMDLRGRTLHTRTTLTQSMISGKQIIQKFSFLCSCEGHPIYEGSSVFGFFPPDAMANQLGLDGRQETLPLYEQPGQGGMQGRKLLLAETPYYQAEIGKPFSRLPDGKMKYISQVFVSPAGGRRGLGYVYARKTIDPADWFFTNHFFEDPVMPGSLGVEAILEAMQVFALEQDLGKGFSSPRFDLPAGQAMTWKYRGQILRTAEVMKVEVHVTGIEKTPGQVLITADASLWADQIRIYELKGAAVRLVEA